MAMAQFMNSVDEIDRDRMDALRIVRGVSRADVGRRLIEQALPAAEVAQGDRLARLEMVAKRAGAASVGGFVRQLVSGRQVIPSLEDLEAMSDANLRKELKWAAGNARVKA
jgi:hypothetical protein